jgi:hypothetical protein
VQSRQSVRAGPDLVGQRLGEDLVTDGPKFRDAVPCDEPQGARLDHREQVGALAERHEPGLLPGEARDVPAGEELATVEPTREVEQRGAPHDRVVQVEERSRHPIGGSRQGGLDLRCGIRHAVTVSRRLLRLRR